jgi:hypothetical protein
MAERHDFRAFRRRPAAQKFHRAAQHVGIECAAQPALAAHHQKQHALLITLLQQRVRPFRNARHRRADHLVQRLGIRAQRQGALLRATQPCRGDELHRARNLLRVPHRTDAPLEI